MRRSLSLGYAAVRRLGVIDVTCLMAADAAAIVSASARMRLGSDTSTQNNAVHRIISDDELRSLAMAERIHRQVGRHPDLANTKWKCACGSDPGGRRQLLGRFDGDRVVSFTWLATHHVAAHDNYSRSPHLGSSLRLPPGVAYVYNAWTDPSHRGRGHMAELMSFATTLGFHHFLCMTDWTNTGSRRAFVKSGFEVVGPLFRMGRGRWQFSRVPDLVRWLTTSTSINATSHRIQTCCPARPPSIAAETPGIRWVV